MLAYTKKFVDFVIYILNKNVLKVNFTYTSNLLKIYWTNICSGMKPHNISRLAINLTIQVAIFNITLYNTCIAYIHLCHKNDCNINYLYMHK